MQTSVKRIVHITPTLPPEINGLGDFSFLLYKEIARSIPAQHIFLVKDLPLNLPFQDVTQFDSKDFFKKLNNIRPDIVILHYVGYAYNTRGVPLYIVDGLKKFKSQSACRVLVYFHELYATSSNPLSSVFYLSVIQQRLVKQLYLLADQVFTNCQSYHEILDKLVGKLDKKLTITGLFSNISEQLVNVEIQKDPGAMIVFGSPLSRTNIYQNPGFRSIIEKLQISKIVDIGAGEVTLPDVACPIEVKGKLTPEQLSCYLNKASFGALNYPPFVLGKSGVLSAYAAYALIPINFCTSDVEPKDGLYKGENYLDSSVSSFEFDRAIMQDNIRSWYKKRDVSTVAQKIIAGFNNN